MPNNSNRKNRKDKPILNPNLKHLINPPLKTNEQIFQDAQLYPKVQATCGHPNTSPITTLQGHYIMCLDCSAMAPLNDVSAAGTLTLAEFEQAQRNARIDAQVDARNAAMPNKIEIKDLEPDGFRGR